MSASYHWHEEELHSLLGWCVRSVLSGALKSGSLLALSVRSVGTQPHRRVTAFIMEAMKKASENSPKFWLSLQFATLADDSQAAMACIRFMSDYILFLATRSLKVLDNQFLRDCGATRIGLLSRQRRTRHSMLLSWSEMFEGAVPYSFLESLRELSNSGCKACRQFPLLLTQDRLGWDNDS